MRGRHASKPIEEVVAEAEELVADGVRELIIVAQDTTYYGCDLYGEPRLAELVSRLDRVAGVDWIRLMYLYPINFSPALIEAIATAERVVPYLDLPLQHINDRVLKRMQRRVSRRQTEELLDCLRRSIPGLVLRTTLLTGFPGETEAEFHELVEFVTERKFERLGVFAYSYEADTPSARLDGHLPLAEREARRDELMATQQRIAFEWSEAQIGRQLDVLIDAPLPDAPTTWIARTSADAPQVDSVVFVTGDDLAAGALLRCEVVASHDYDLVAAAVGRPR